MLRSISHVEHIWPVDANKENTIRLKKLGYFLNRMSARLDLIEIQWQR